MSNTPQGFQYRDDFISVAEEAALLEDIGRIEFANFEMRGVIAKRRVAFFGATYDLGATSDEPNPAPSIPDFLRPLMTRAATHEILLAPRSAYLMTGESRSAYEHSIPPVAELRYSVTFRTLRAGRGRSGRTRRLPRTGR